MTRRFPLLPGVLVAGVAVLAGCTSDDEADPATTVVVSTTRPSTVPASSVPATVAVTTLVPSPSPSATPAPVRPVPITIPPAPRPVPAPAVTADQSSSTLVDLTPLVSEPGSDQGGPPVFRPGDATDDPLPGAVPHEVAVAFTEGNAEAARAVNLGDSFEVTLPAGADVSAVMAIGANAEIQGIPADVTCEGPPAAGDGFYQFFDGSFNPVSDAFALCATAIGDIVPPGTYYVKFVAPVDRSVAIDTQLTATAV